MSAPRGPHLDRVTPEGLVFPWENWYELRALALQIGEFMAKRVPPGHRGIGNTLALQLDRLLGVFEKLDAQTSEESRILRARLADAERTVARLNARLELLARHRRR